MELAANDLAQIIAKANASPGSTFLAGPSAAVPGVSAKIDWVFERTQGKTKTELGSIYPSAAQSYVSYQETVPSTYSGSIADCMFLDIDHQTPNADGVALHAIAKANGANIPVWGANFIARNEAGSTLSKLVGIEIDVQPSLGTTVDTSTCGLIINAFNLVMNANAILIGSSGGGTFQNGLVIGPITGAGVSPNGTSQMDSLINTGVGTYVTAAIILSNNHKELFKGVSKHARIYNDTSDNFRIVNSNKIIFRNNADTSSLISLDDTGLINFEAAGITSTSATAGGASALPATPAGYLFMKIAGTNYKFPYYN
jgi:hypothetical protein